MLEFRKNNLTDNIKNIKYSANIFLGMEPVANESFPFIIYHPFISQNPSPYKNKSGQLEFIDIFKDINKYNDLINQKKKYIENSKSFEEILLMICKPYQLLFLNLNKNNLSEKTYNNSLKDVWISTEFPNADKNVSVDESLKLFKKANKNLIMNSKEKIKMKSLPDEVKIYRGTHKKNNYKALSWTDNYESALWFSKRYSGDGYVLEALIKKEDILACFNERNENELIIDYNKIYNLKVEKIMDIKI